MEKAKGWKVLREHPDVELVLCDLPAGIKALYVTEGPDAAILVNRRLGQVERLAAMLHELAHHRRGGGCHHRDTPPLLRVATEREEVRVRAIVAAEMLPDDKLRPYVERHSEFGMVLAWQVADDFDVPIEIADLALQRLAVGF